MSKENQSCKCLSLIMLDSVANVKKKYYLQTLLEECKYEIKNTKMESFINDDLERSSSNDETDSDFDNESDNKAKNHLRNLIMNLTMNLAINLTMSQTINNLPINLKIKTVP